MNIVSCVLCLMLYYQQKKHKSFDFLGSTAFNSILWTSVLVLALDIIAWLMVGNVIKHTDRQLMHVLSAYYFVQSMLPLFFLLYCINTNGKKLHYVTQAMLYIPVAFTLVVLLLNYDKHIAFYLLDNRVKRADGFMLSIIAPLIYIIICVIMNAHFYFKSTKENRKVTFHLLVCILISFAGAVLSAFVPSVTPWHIFVFALIYLYMQMHSDQEKQLDIIAYQDLLTGFKNYAAYTQEMSDIDNMIKTNDDAKFAVAMLDVNGLKAVNDAYGHESGNALIRASTHLIGNVFVNSDIFRIGGDEFVVILKDSDYEIRSELYESFLKQMKETTFTVGGKKHPVSVAIGIADYDGSRHNTYDDVFHAADKTMYDNKYASKCVLSNPNT